MEKTVTKKLRGVLKYGTLLFFMLSCFTSLAQSVITGVVTDEGLPLPGASIVIKGTSTGTVTDFNGNYSLSVNPGDVLVISFVGYSSKTIPVDGRSVINIEMEEDITSLSEIVVVGYGTQQKVNVTGAVSVVNSEELEGQPVANTANLLQGRMPGVQLTTPGGQPGNDAPVVRVRGAVSIGGDANNANKNNPLVLIDGVQSSLTDFGLLNPNNIESVSVLKDAASAAIYGTRAAGGVILVTTKQGKDGRINISLDAYTAVQEAIVLPDFVDSWDYAILQNEARINAGRTPYFTDEEIESLRTGEDPDFYPNTDWFDELFSSALMSKYDLTISGGNDKVTYNISGGYLGQDGILLKQEANRVNFRSNTRVKVSDRISTGLNIWGYRNTAYRSNSPTSEIMRRAYFAQPLIPVFWTKGEAEGEYAGFTDLGTGNPKAVQQPVQRALTGRNKSIQDKFSIQLNNEIQILEGLKYASLVAYTINNNNSSTYRPIAILTRFDGTQAPQSIVETSASRSFSTVINYQVDNILTYDKTLGKHTFNMLLGHSYVDNESSDFNASGTNLPGSLEVLDVAVDDLNIGGEESDWSLLSYFARVNYSYNDKYLLEATLRRDASSRFPDGNKWATFPSVSAGWRISNEPFMANVGVIDELKLRAGYGKVGNDQITNYPHAQSISVEQFYTDVDENLVTGAGITRLANPSLRWEETVSKNIGLDLGLFNNKFQFTAEYFDNVSDGILVRLPLPGIFGGVGSPFENAASVKNSGFEFLASYRQHLGDFSFNISANFSTLKNEVLDFNDQERIDGLRIIKEGEPINSFFGLRHIGIFQTQEEVDNHAFQDNVTSPGDLKYEDIDNNGVIDNADRVIIGKPLPGFSYGFTLGANYKNIDFSAFFQGVGDVEVYSNGFGNSAVNNPRAGTISDWLNRWTPENPSTEYVRVIHSGVNQGNSSYWLRNASYLRLKNIQLGYTIDNKITDKVGINSLRVYVSGQNLLTFTEVENWDPEQLPSVINMTQHPQTKVYAIGLNANF